MNTRNRKVSAKPEKSVGECAVHSFFASNISSAFVLCGVTAKACPGTKMGCAAGDEFYRSGGVRGKYWIHGG
jgi:hypothetical protein